MYGLGVADLAQDFCALVSSSSQVETVREADEIADLEAGDNSSSSTSVRFLSFSRPQMGSRPGFAGLSRMVSLRSRMHKSVGFEKHRGLVKMAVSSSSAEILHSNKLEEWLMSCRSHRPVHLVGLIAIGLRI